MTNPTTLPARLAFKTGDPRTFLPVGSAGSHGDAGWTVYKFETAADRALLMAQYPGARMPCWNRIEARP